MISVTWEQLIAVLLVQAYVVYRLSALRQKTPTEGIHTMKVVLDKGAIDTANREVDALAERINRLSDAAMRYNDIVAGTNI